MKKSEIYTPERIGSGEFKGYPKIRKQSQWQSQLQ